MRMGRPGPEDAVAVWGHAPRAARGVAAAQATGAALWRIEDGWLRSIHPGRIGKRLGGFWGGEPPAGLLLDRTGVHYDPARPSDLETLLATHPLDDNHLLNRAQACMARLQDLHLSKYNLHDLRADLPEPGYVLVLDQVRGDASLRDENGPLSAQVFREMLITAQLDHPDARIVIKTHPDTQTGTRPGHFGREDVDARVKLYTGHGSPWDLLKGAVAVYTVSSQMGFEAILCGHRPRVFGMPFYAGWGLTQDETPPQRRRRSLTRAQLFAGAMLLYPLWYDPQRDRLCDLETVIDHFEARLRVFRQDRAGHVAQGVHWWKRAHMRAFFGTHQRLRFGAPGTLGWAGRVPEGFTGLRVEDGFLRSRGLGADLVPPVSLVVDDRGIYYDPNRPSAFESLMQAPLPQGAGARAAALRAAILRAGVTKYNSGAAGAGLAAVLDEPLAELRAERPDAQVLLVPGQVEDDASIRLGCTGAWRTNRDLLTETRARNPGAIVIYKPHPDVEAGLRPGNVPDAERLADLVVRGADADALIARVDAVWTLTSGLGFEALVRGKPVTCLGAPFYAGWGLTGDLAPLPDRRGAWVGDRRLTLDHLVHAALIAYPRYLDPATRTPCAPELVVERLARGEVPPPAMVLRLLARMQRLLSRHASVWRR
jgi:capsular polysaccharide export protein